MNKEKISTQEIIDLVAAKASISKRAAEEFLKVMISTIEDTLLTGESVKIKNFGTFKLQWNEPRKSVDVNTSEEILISGYYKVNFTPDATLKGLINEPFAHLESIQLDENSEEKEIIKQSEGIDPLRIFTEQATEIKNLISEIQALSPSNTLNEESESDEVEDEIEEDDDELDLMHVIHEEFINDIDETEVDEIHVVDFVEHENEVEELKTEVVVDAPEAFIKQDEIKTEELKQEEITDSEIFTSPFSDKIRPLNRRKSKISILVLLVLLVGSGYGLYYFYLPATNLMDNSYQKSKLYVNDLKEKISITDMVNSISNRINPEKKLAVEPLTVIVPKDTTDVDSIESIQPVDSLQMLFDNPRVYTEFIASEMIKQGSRLTLMARRYYGSKDFWVYIYEANKVQIPNPDQISRGTLIRIPKLDPRLIDVTNPRCLNKAKELHDIYVK